MSTGKERRVSERFKTDFDLEGFGKLEFLNFPNSIPLRDLSYGGFSIKAKENSFDEKQNDYLNSDNIKFKLHLLGDIVEGSASFASSPKEFMGFSFKHENTKVLVFLRNFLEFMRWGTRLEAIDKKLVKEKYRTDEFICFRGEGPTDCIFRVNNTGEIEEMLLTFREKEEYRELAFKNEKISTRKAIDFDGDATRMSETESIDVPIFRKGISILIGLIQSPTHRRLGHQALKKCLPFFKM